MKSMLESHAASRDSGDYDVFNSYVDMGEVDMREMEREMERELNMGFEENNIDCNSSNSNSNSNSHHANNNNNNNTNNTPYPHPNPGHPHPNHPSKYSSVCPAIMRRLRDLDRTQKREREKQRERGGEREGSRGRSDSHDWEIKMLLTPESPPDTPRL